MAVETKPLFCPEVVRKHLHGFTLAESVASAKPRLQHWADLIASGKADSFKETALLPDFITDIFGHLLGYTGPAGSGGSFTLLRETHVEVDGQFADAALGRFATDSKKFTVAVEGKGTRDPLDRPFSGRRMSAVDQAYRYAIGTRGAGVGPCHLDSLLRHSESAGRELTNKFYTLYAGIRQKVFGFLHGANPAAVPEEILRCTQKLLDRVLFCSFSEDRGLLPQNTVRGAFEHNDPYNPRPVWDNFRGLFRSVDVGNAGLKIPAYNGGLFAHDPGLDQLQVPDAACALFRDLAEYDFRPARDLVEADESVEIRPVIDVDILGHIFEHPRCLSSDSSSFGSVS